MAILETETQAPKPPWRRPLALIGWALWAFFLLVTLGAHRNFPQIFKRPETPPCICSPPYRLCLSYSIEKLRSAATSVRP